MAKWLAQHHKKSRSQSSFTANRILLFLRDLFSSKVLCRGVTGFLNPLFMGTIYFSIICSHKDKDKLHKAIILAEWRWLGSQWQQCKWWEMIGFWVYSEDRGNGICCWIGGGVGKIDVKHYYFKAFGLNTWKNGVTIFWERLDCSIRFCFCFVFWQIVGREVAIRVLLHISSLLFLWRVGSVVVARGL